MAWIWTKLFSSLDDGNILTGQNIGDIQADVTNNAVDITSVQTITGSKSFTGTVTFSGTVTDIYKTAELVFYDDELVGYDGDAVVYQ